MLAKTSPWRFDRPPRCWFESGAAGVDTHDDRPTHARVPGLGDVLGDFCRRRVFIPRFEKLADLVGLLGRAG